LKKKNITILPQLLNRVYNFNFQLYFKFNLFLGEYSPQSYSTSFVKQADLFFRFALTYISHKEPGQMPGMSVYKKVQQALSRNLQAYLRYNERQAFPLSVMQYRWTGLSLQPVVRENRGLSTDISHRTWTLDSHKGQHAAAPVCTAPGFSYVTSSISNPNRVPVPRAHQSQHAAAPYCTALEFSYTTNSISSPNRMHVPRARRRQHAATPILHGLEVFLPQISISNKRVPAPQGARRRQSIFSHVSLVSPYPQRHTHTYPYPYPQTKAKETALLYPAHVRAAPGTVEKEKSGTPRQGRPIIIPKNRKNEIQTSLKMAEIFGHFGGRQCQPPTDPGLYKNGREPALPVPRFKRIARPIPDVRFSPRFQDFLYSIVFGNSFVILKKSEITNYKSQMTKPRQGTLLEFQITSPLQTKTAVFMTALSLHHSNTPILQFLHPLAGIGMKEFFHIVSPPSPVYMRPGPGTIEKEKSETSRQGRPIIIPNDRKSEITNYKSQITKPRQGTLLEFQSTSPLQTKTAVFMTAQSLHHSNTPILQFLQLPVGIGMKEFFHTASSPYSIHMRTGPGTMLVLPIARPGGFPTQHTSSQIIGESPHRLTAGPVKFPLSSGTTFLNSLTKWGLYQAPDNIGMMEFFHTIKKGMEGRVSTPQALLPTRFERLFQKHLLWQTVKEPDASVTYLQAHRYTYPQAKHTDTGDTTGWDLHQPPVRMGMRDFFHTVKRRMEMTSNNRQKTGITTIHHPTVNTAAARTIPTNTPQLDYFNPVGTIQRDLETSLAQMGKNAAPHMEEETVYQNKITGPEIPVNQNIHAPGHGISHQPPANTDLDRLTDRVYRMLEDKIRIEKEMRGW
jgi:hypothetical protein